MKNGDSPAYPLPIAGCTDGGVYNTMEKDCTTGGLTKREMFAMSALQGLLFHTVSSGLRTNEDYAKKAIQLADELLKQLEA